MVAGREHWKSISVGLYNGGIIVNLTESLPKTDYLDEEMRDAVQRIGALSIADCFVIEPRTSQITATLKEGFSGQLGKVAAIFQATFDQSPALDLKTQVSSHSVDIIRGNSSKADVVTQLESYHGGLVMAIGPGGRGRK